MNKDKSHLSFWCPYCSCRLGWRWFISSLLRWSIQPSLSGENLWPVSQRLPVPTHVEAPSQWSPNRCADAAQRRGSLGVHQVNNYRLMAVFFCASLNREAGISTCNATIPICLNKTARPLFSWISNTATFFKDWFLIFQVAITVTSCLYSKKINLQGFLSC